MSCCGSNAYQIADDAGYNVDEHLSKISILRTEERKEELKIKENWENGLISEKEGNKLLKLLYKKFDKKIADVKNMEAKLR